MDLELLKIGGLAKTCETVFTFGEELTIFLVFQPLSLNVSVYVVEFDLSLTVLIT